MSLKAKAIYGRAANQKRSKSNAEVSKRRNLLAVLVEDRGEQMPSEALEMVWLEPATAEGLFTGLHFSDH
jgi:hypothetical protein